jgi:hypothetical protein
MGPGGAWRVCATQVDAEQGGTRPLILQRVVSRETRHDGLENRDRIEFGDTSCQRGASLGRCSGSDTRQEMVARAGLWSNQVARHAIVKLAGSWFRSGSREGGALERTSGTLGRASQGQNFAGQSGPAEEPNLHNESDSREGSSRGNEAERRHGGELQIAGAIEWRWGLSSTSSRSGLGIAGQQASVSGLGKERCLAMTEQSLKIPPFGVCCCGP